MKVQRDVYFAFEDTIIVTFTVNTMELVSEVVHLFPPTTFVGEKTLLGENLKVTRLRVVVKQPSKRFVMTLEGKLINFGHFLILIEFANQANDRAIDPNA